MQETDISQADVDNSLIAAFEERKAVTDVLELFAGEVYNLLNPTQRQELTRNLEEKEQNLLAGHRGYAGREKVKSTIARLEYLLGNGHLPDNNHFRKF